MTSVLPLMDYPHAMQAATTIIHSVKTNRKM